MNCYALSHAVYSASFFPIVSVLMGVYQSNFPDFMATIIGHNAVSPVWTTMRHHAMSRERPSR
jgi:hypothetical protein